jgi:hypothetical protein
MSQAHFIKAQVVGGPVPQRPVFVEKVVALIVVSLALAVLICLAAIAPAMWAFATAAAAESYIPVGLPHCVSIEDNLSRLACYDESTRLPAKGTSGLSRAFGEVQRER